MMVGVLPGYPVEAELQCKLSRTFLSLHSGDQTDTVDRNVFLVIQPSSGCFFLPHVKIKQRNPKVVWSCT